MTIPIQWDQNASAEAVKEICFDEQEAFWQHDPNNSLGVDVAVDGPLTDKYGHNFTGLYGECYLTQSTAQLFAWDNLSPDQAWNDYDMARLTS